MFSEMLERNLGCGIEEAGEVYFSLLSRTLAGNPKQAELEYVNCFSCCLKLGNVWQERSGVAKVVKGTS